MTGTGAESGVGAWRAPECPYTIDYSARVLDDIRLAVVDAFFSLPRGGAEIGGILLGKFLNGKISILDHEALDCEHAMGPSFNLSPRDQSRLAEMVAKAQEGAGGMRPVGWYHSHTRSEIFLSDADQDIHKRFFPEPWQIALVLKPHIFDPTRGGFFFREADGSIRGSATYQEFVLDTLPIRPVPSGAAPAMPPAPRPLHSGAEPQGPVITLEPERAHDAAPLGPAPPEPAVEPAKSAEPLAELDDLPSFLQIKQEREWRGLRIVVGLAAAIALCAAGYETRQTWLPVVQAKTAPLMAKLRPVLPKKPAPHLALSTTDDNGQLQIHWDGNSPAVQEASEGVLEISDGWGLPQAVKLDTAHLQAGTFTYGREGDRVDVTLIVERSNGQPVKEVASFLGKIPERKPVPEDPEVRQERDQLRQQADKLIQDLGFQAAKTRKLEKDLNDVRDQLQKEQKRRLENQLDPGKQE